jgi:hypothetical protein
MRFTAIVLLSWAALAGAAWSPDAAASPPYPGLIHDHLSLSYAPPCSICHQNGVTGYGTAITPFGQSMRDQGLRAEDPGSLATALDQLAANNTDSDGDGVPDIQELVKGTDPNGPGVLGATRTPQLAYGCGAAITPIRPSRGSGSAFAGVLLGALGLAAVRRRRRGALLLAALTTAAVLVGCYDASYVSPDVCSSGVMWTGNSGSPNMNPGLACLGCHAQRAGATFAFAGTVFARSTESDLCFGEPEATIVIAGADGRTIELMPSEAGNFYSKLPVGLPFTAAVLVGGKVSVMSTPQISGDCNGCHRPQGSNGAPGRIVVP